MATWRDFVGFIDRTYKYEILNDDLLKLVFNTSNLRTQLVFLEHATCNSGVEWFKVNSPIGKLTPQQVMYAARRLEDMVVGGIIINDNMVFVTTAMPLENIDASEITDSIERVWAIVLGHRLSTHGCSHALYDFPERISILFVLVWSRRCGSC